MLLFWIKSQGKAGKTGSPGEPGMNGADVSTVTQFLWVMKQKMLCALMWFRGNIVQRNLMLVTLWVKRLNCPCMHNRYTYKNKTNKHQPQSSQLQWYIMVHMASKKKKIEIRQLSFKHKTATWWSVLNSCVVGCNAIHLCGWLTHFKFFWNWYHRC